MRLTILRHGKAGDRTQWDGDDTLRPLTEQGRKHCRAVCERLTPALHYERIWTSPWLRARQTAEIAAEILGGQLHEAAWLAGDAGDAEQRCAELARQAHGIDRLMLVVHEPSLGELIGFLCAAAPIPLKKSGIALLAGEAEAGGMRLRALLPPKLLLEL